MTSGQARREQIINVAREQHVNLLALLEGFQLASQTEAWEGLVYVIHDMGRQYLELSAYAEEESERHVYRGAHEACKAIVNAMTTELRSVLGATKSDKT